MQWSVMMLTTCSHFTSAWWQCLIVISFFVSTNCPFLLLSFGPVTLKIPQS
jgi:hypothetical protein